MENIEIERRFLLIPLRVKRFLKSLNIDYKIKRVEQYYLKSTNEVVRYRKVDNIFIKTIKRGYGLVRQEFENSVSQDEYNLFLLQKDGKVIKKVRYTCQIDGFTLEIDEFKGNLKGLVILEVEFTSKEQANSYTLPKFFEPYLVSEITGIKKFSNKALSKSIFIPSIDSEIKINNLDGKNAKLVLDYNPYSRLDSVLKAAIKILATTIKERQNAIINEDYDIENLHQIRVSCRKLLSILNSLICFIKIEKIDMLLENLKTIISITNIFRNLDIFIENFTIYRFMLKSEDKEEIDRLKKELKLKRDKMQERLNISLDSPLFNTTLNYLYDIANGKIEILNNKELPIYVAYKDVIEKMQNNFLVEFKKINKNSKPRELHKVRIKAKNMRYILEFFKPLVINYDEVSNEYAKIQKQLGLLQDLTFEIEHLESIKNSKNQDTIKKLQKLLKDKYKSKKREFLDNISD